MVNSQTIKEIIDALKIDTNIEMVPNAVPVVEVNPKIVKPLLVVSNVRTSSGASTLMTTSGSADTYIKAITFGVTKNVTCDVASGQVALSAYIGGVNTGIINIPILTLTAEYMSITIDLGTGIKIDRNTTITFGNQTFTAGAMIRTATIYYYLDEVL